MKDQIDTVLHWSNQKEHEQAKRKDKVIRRNLDRIRISAATPLPSNPSRYSQVSFIQKQTNKTKKKKKYIYIYIYIYIKKNPHQKIK